MSVTMPENGVPTVPATTASHPTACPSWCRDRGNPGVHAFGPTATWHFSPTLLLPTIAPTVDGEDTMMRVELVREDEGDDIGVTRMSVVGESEADLDPAAADVWLAQLVSFTKAALLMRAQMDAS